MRVAVVQFAAGTDKRANLARLGDLVAQAVASGATLVVGPEAAMHGFGDGSEPLAPVAEPLDGAFVTGLTRCASRHGVTIVAGMFEPVEDDAAFAYNTVVAVGPDGELIGRYRKQHLFDALGWSESKRLSPGSVEERLVFDCGEFRAG